MIMKNKSVLWIDDDIRALSGLKAYLHEIQGLVLRTARTFDGAIDELTRGEPVNLLLFDMVLMEDGEYAALDRRMGILVARKAIEKGVKLFVSYTVLSRAEVMDAWKNLMAQDGNDIKFEHFAKAEASVQSIQETVRGMLDGE